MTDQKTNPIWNGINRALKQRKDKREWASVLAVLAVVVALGVAAVLMQRGVAMTHTEQILDCPVTGTVAHTHDDSCYDEDGYLVCELPELELHEHDDSCYETEEVLTCELPEDENHEHTDECYETVTTLVCDKEEVTEEHVHGPGCFRTVTVVDDEDEDELEDDEEEMPEQTFEHSFVNDEDELVLMVVVDAPKGALPAGTTMKAELVDLDEENQQLVEDAVSQKSKGKVLDCQAVDITFYDEDGQEIEPATDVTVTLTSSLIDTEEKPLVVHVESDREAQKRAEAQGKKTYEIEADVVDQLTERELDKRDVTLDDDQLAFDTDAFSTYVLATASQELEMTATGDDQSVSITVEAPAAAGIPQDAEVQVSEIEQGTKEYKSYLKQIIKALAAENIVVARFFDITLVSGDEELQPQAPVGVKVALDEELTENVQALHFGEEGPEVMDASLEGDAVAFETEGFSIYAIVETTIEKSVLASDGHNYKVSVTYGADAEVPTDAELSVEEILEDSSDYETYASQAEDALGLDEGSASYLRLFDIKIVDKQGEKVEIAAPVDVKIELADYDGENEAQVVHFPDGSAEPEVVQDVSVDGEAVSFEADGFSAYAIVTGPSGAEAGWEKLASVDDLTSSGGYYIGHTSGYYLTRQEATQTSDTNTVTGIKRTSQNVVPSISGAERYYFEKASDGNYYIYFMDSETKKYVVNNGDASLSFTDDENDKTAFTVEVNNKGVFKIHNDDWYWNMQTKKNTDAGFYALKKANDGNNNLYLWEQTDPDTDTYKLDGETYGLMTWTGGKTAKALMAVENTDKDENDQPYSGCLEAKFLTVMAKKSSAGNKLYVPDNTTDTATTWTFEWVRNDPNNRTNSYYYLKANNGKYLKITSDGLSLVDENEKDESCLIQVKPGTGNNEGQICLKSVGNNSKTLTYSGEYKKGYNVGGTAGIEWLHLVEPKSEDLLADYQRVYTATKVSISDTEKVKTGDKIIIYARQWKNNHYEYYAINSEGKLVPCTESGDTIEWYGGNINDMLWQFTEYVYEGTDTPNGYYELENLYARSIGKPSYLAPKDSDGSILFDHTVGVLLQGRTNKQYYSPIVAWDTPDYMYSALTVDLNQAEPVLEPCVRKDGLDFYFAIMEDLPVDDELVTVPTVDNEQYGITMKMVDLANGTSTSDLTGQMNAFLQNGIKDGKTLEHTPGLLSTNLDVNTGYPTTMNAGSGGSLSTLYAGAQTVNHLFIDSTYRATGYFEYDSAQNFASLQGSDFVVYQQLGSNDTTKKDTLQHGQFFPYNDIEAGRFTSINKENMYSVTAENMDTTTPDLLPDSDPRKHEQLYLVKDNTDYYFGMELEASFVQTPNGLDAWGHDIIFEFSGDDDFWLYVDGELVIDLGGIHSAVTGTVNFRTGQVVVNPKSKDHAQNTTLYDLFVANYMARNLTEEQAKAKADELFAVNEEGNRVFKDNTNHTMRIFYMERGAGASNLHMKFNLASVKKGTVELHKELEGTDETETTNAVFPYQVYYRMENETSSDSEHMLRNAIDPNTVSGSYTNTYGASTTDYVFYKDTAKPVTFLPELEVDGVTYYNVFMLKPDETAVLNFPVLTLPNSDEKITVGQYRIVECGIDPEVFTQVTVNGEVNSGVKNSQNKSLSDYGIDMASTDDRPRVDYVNKVENLKNLTFTKELYRKFNANAELVKVNPNGDSIAESALRTQQDSDEATFGFRLYFKTPYDNDFTPANVHIYHVKDPEGYYCTWNSEAGRFERITSVNHPDYLKPDHENGTKDYANLTDDVADANGTVTHLGKFAASFETSPNGSLSGIPAYYTVEVRGLIPGTEYKLVERPNETPDGYKFWQYANDDDPDGSMHNGSDSEHPYDPLDGIAGTIGTNVDASATVKNYMGYGFRLEKVWEDATSMQDRDPVYFALYTTGSNEQQNKLVDGSVRKLTYDADPQQVYWWYLLLPIANTTLSDYTVFEVELTGDNIAVDDDGIVTGYTGVTPIDGGGIVQLNGTLVGQSDPKVIKYTVTYEQPKEAAFNVRTYKATNSPADLPQVRFVKTDWNGTKLPGADFSLRYGENLANSLFDPETKTSDEHGLIAQVYLQENVEYTLTELKSRQGYVGLNEPLVVKLVSTTAGWKLEVTPNITDGDPEYYTVSKENDILTLTVKNHPYEFKAVKVDSTNTDVKLKGAKFSLYKQVTVGNTTWDEENPVYTGLTTDTNGVIPHIDASLPAGTYQLRETAAPSRYSKLTANIDFTISEMGVMTLGNHPDGVSLTSTTYDSGKIIYSIIIPNTPQPLKLEKQDDKGNKLNGAKFRLMTLDAANEWVVMTLDAAGTWSVVTDRDSNKVYDDVDMTSASEFELSGLPAGRYCLEETHAPDGYIILTKHIYFTIGSNRTVKLTYEDGSNWNNSSQAEISSGGGVYKIIVKNKPGAALPHTGGSGTSLFTILGSMMILGAGVLLWRERRLIRAEG